MPIKSSKTQWGKNREALKLPAFANADLPAAAENAYCIAYDTDASAPYFCDGSSWSSIDASASSLGLNASYDVDANIDIDAAGGALEIDYAAAGSVITLDADTNSVTVTDGIKFATTGTSSAFTDAIDASDSGITNALNVGGNLIIGTGISIDGDGTCSFGATTVSGLTGVASATLAIAAGATGQKVTLNGNGSGAVEIGLVSTGNVTIGDGDVANVNLQSGTEIDLTSTTIDINGNVEISGTLGVTGATTLTGTFYTSALAPASGNITLNAASTGIITIGNLSTGGIVISDNMTIGQPALFSTTTKLNFHDADISIYASADGQLDIDADGVIQLATASFDCNATAFDIDATSASAMTVTGANLTVETASSGVLDLNAAGNFTLDAGGTFSIDAVGNSNITTDSGNIEVNCTTSGVITIDGFSEIDFEIANADQMKYTTGSMQFQQATSISTTAGALTLAPTTDVLVSNGLGLVVGGAQLSVGGGASALTPEVQVLGTATADGSLGLYTASATANASLVFGRDKGASLGTHTVVADDDVLGTIDFAADDGTDTNTVSARIRGEVDDATPTTSDIGGALVFMTHVGGSTDNISEKARISAAGDLLIANGGGLVVGHTGQIAAGAISELQVLGTALADGSAIIGVAAASALAPDLQFVKSRSANTFATPAVVVDNDEVGRLVFLPDDGTDYATEAAVFQAEVDDATPATGDVGMAFVWESMAGGGAAIAERMRLSATGDLIIANGGGLVVGHTGQIDAGATSELQVLGTAIADASAVIGIASANAVGGDLQFVKSRSADTFATPAAVVDNDVVGRIVFLPDDGTDYATEAAVFSAEVDDATPTTGDIGMAFVWDSMPGAAGAQREVMRLNAAGTLSILTSAIVPAVYGSIASGGDLGLISTTHGTEGTVYIPDGTAGLHLGAAGDGWAGDNYVYFKDATVPPAGAPATQGSGLYSAAGELYAIDNGGNATKISPHDDDGFYVFSSTNTTTGKKLVIHMEKMMKKLAEKFPEDFASLIEEK